MLEIFLWYTCMCRYIYMYIIMCSLVWACVTSDGAIAVLLHLTLACIRLNDSTSKIQKHLVRQASSVQIVESPKIIFAFTAGTQ